MVKAGLSEEVVINAIKTQPGRYDVHPDDLIALKTAGVSDKIILAMQDSGLPQTPRSRASGLQTHRSLPPSLNVDIATPATAAVLADGVDELGVYYRAPSGMWVSLKAERLTLKSGGTIKNILSDGFILRDMNGHIDGAKSPLVL
ncbi:MAG: hypothetical protein ABI142_09905, partial [Bryocella sp.]